MKKKSILDEKLTQKRKKLIYELLENVPAGFYVTINSITDYLCDNNDEIKITSLLCFITNYCVDIYESKGPGFYYFGLTDSHEYSAEPDAITMLKLLNYYRKGRKRA